MTASSTLERAISKIINDDLDLIKNRDSFSRIVGNLFEKKAVRQGIKDYLSSHASSPRIMSILLYSEEGNKLLIDLVQNKGMPVSRLYDPLVYDGSGFARSEIELPIAKNIIHGGDQWNFRAHEWFDKVDRLTAFPGAISAMVERFRARSKIEQVIRHMPMSTMADLLEHEPGVFQHEVDSISQLMADMVDPEDRYRDTAICLVRTFLNQTEAIGKILGSQPQVVND